MVSYISNCGFGKTYIFIREKFVRSINWECWNYYADCNKYITFHYGNNQLLTISKDIIQTDKILNKLKLLTTVIRIQLFVTYCLLLFCFQ